MTAAPVRVVHLITELDRGGAESMLVRMLAATDRARSDPAVVSLVGGGPLTADIETLGIPVHSAGMHAGRISAGAVRRLVALLRRLHPDVLQTWLPHADLAGTIAGRLARVPHIVWNIRCADLDPRDHPRSLSFVLRGLAFASRRPSAVVCNSTAGRQAHERLGYAPRRWLLIPNGFDTAAFRPDAAARAEVRRELGVGPDTPLVGLLARMHSMKDHATYVRAAAIVVRERDDVRFVAAGRGVGDTDALRHLSAELGLTPRLTLLPERADAPRFLAALDVSVSSSYSEAFPNVLGESMACGVPCVATDVGESASIVGDTGRVVPARDPEALARGILDLLALDASSRERLRRAARQRIIDQFAIDRVARQYESLYDDLAGRVREADGACAG